ncbi:MAG: hydroxyisourate hydrolase [Polyangia bacterium]
MSAITTHVLDTSLGRPAAGVTVVLEREGIEIGRGVTDADGRVKTLLADGVRPQPGAHRLTFDVGAYFAKGDRTTFFPTVQITFEVTVPVEHHHVPLLLSPFGYSTYRGS